MAFFWKNIMVIECTKKMPNPKDDKFAGTCDYCKSEFKAQRQDLKINERFDRNETIEWSKTECKKCHNGTISFYKTKQK